jgi:hypothetical protein
MDKLKDAPTRREFPASMCTVNSAGASKSLRSSHFAWWENRWLCDCVDSWQSRIGVSFGTEPPQPNREPQEGLPPSPFRLQGGCARIALPRQIDAPDSPRLSPPKGSLLATHSRRIGVSWVRGAFTFLWGQKETPHRTPEPRTTESGALDAGLNRRGRSTVMIRLATTPALVNVSRLIDRAALMLSRFWFEVRSNRNPSFPPMQTDQGAHGQEKRIPRLQASVLGSQVFIGRSFLRHCIFPLELLKSGRLPCERHVLCWMWLTAFVLLVKV